MAIHLIYHDLTNTATTSPFDIAIQQLVHNADVHIACPYLTLEYVRSLVESSHSWRLLTDVQAWIHSQRRAASAIQHFIERYGEHIHDLRGLHAKVIIAHDKAFFGSANFTNGGLTHNDELSIVIDQEPMVATLHQWFNQRWEQTRTPDLAALAAYIQDLASEPAEERPRTARTLPSTGPVIQAKLLPRAPSDRTSTETTDRQPRVCRTCGKCEDHDDVQFYASHPHHCKSCRGEEMKKYRKHRASTSQESFRCARCRQDVPRENFYPLQGYCKPCYNKIQIKARQKPERKSAVSSYNTAWLKNHPEVPKRAQRKYQQRIRAKKVAQRPEGKLSFSEAAKVLGVSRQRVSQYVNEGRLLSTPDPNDKRRRLLDVADVERLKAEREKRDA